MNSFRTTLAVGALTAVMAPVAPALASQGAAASAQTADQSGVHGFDFEIGTWRVHHRTKPAGSSTWVEFDGTCSNRPLMDGLANVEDHAFNRPTGITHGVALRAYDTKTGQWAIWWLDSRAPFSPLDPPMKGSFSDGVGTFYSDGLINGIPTRTRLIWSHITATGARWEQAFSTDEGKTWDTNWVMDFTRTAN